MSKEEKENNFSKIQKQTNLINEQLKILKLNNWQSVKVHSNPKPTDLNQDRLDKINLLAEKIEKMRSEPVDKSEVEEIKTYEVRI